MDSLIGIWVLVVILPLLLLAIQLYYRFSFDIIQDVNLNKILIVWYNKYLPDGEITRVHKILYDTGRNKTRHFRFKK